MKSSDRVVILGGYGTFGSLVADRLVSSGRVVIAGHNRQAGERYAESIGADFALCDVKNRASLSQAIAGATVVVNASGPYKAGDYAIPQACIEAGCHYLDLADGRAYVAGIGALDARARQNGCFVCAGASTAPAVTSSLVSRLAEGLGRIRSIRTVLTAGNKNQPGVSTLASILSYTGGNVRIWQDGQWTTARGWGMAEFVRFPKPVGRRRVQLVDVPDLALFPGTYQADTVIFKAGVELALFNYALSALGLLKAGFTSLDLPALAGTLVGISRWFKIFGSQSGCITTEVTGRDGRKRSATLLAPHNGPRIPTAPAVILARRLLSNGPPAIGAFPCIGFIALTELDEYLKPFDISVVA
jgi:saccharopine dehydrogenase-like NADP-dependent oxidoreductase